MNEHDLSMPATLPGTMQEQIRALLPYVVNHGLSMQGWMLELKIPMDAFVTMKIDKDQLAGYGIQWSVNIDTRGLSFDGPCGRKQSPVYAEVELSYRYPL